MDDITIGREDKDSKEMVYAHDKQTFVIYSVERMIVYIPC